MENRRNLDILKSKETYLLGILDINRDQYPNLGETQEAVSVMKNRNYSDTDYYTDNNNVLFYIKSVSEEPEYIKNNINPQCNSKELYVGIDIHHKNIDILPFGYKEQNIYNLLSSEEKKKRIFDELEGKLLLFKPYITYDQYACKVYKNLQIQKIICDYEEGISYRAIPKINIPNHIFESKLKRGEYIYLEDYNHNMLPPEFIICNDYIYYDFMSWKKHEVNYKLWSCDKNQHEIRKSKIHFNEDDYRYDVINILDNLKFLSVEFLDYIYDSLEDNGDFIFTKDEVDVELTNNNEKNNNTFHIEKSIEAMSRKCENEDLDFENKKCFNEEEMDKIFKSTSDESNFLKNFKNYTIKHNLCYDMKDLLNFHISIKTNQLTILAGMSGTGKTQIAKAYGEMLGINKENKTLLFLPISPSYTQPEDLLGYLNNTTGLYVASETGFVDFLIHAENNKDKMHMVIFDEMNLSQVEHWFAPFISLLELNHDERNLQLYSSNAICHNNIKYKRPVVLVSH